MRGYEGTRLWESSLAQQIDDPHAESRQRLRSAYLNFRERAAVLAAEIPQDLREFTVHDATHIDALWETADIIAGGEISLTPVEAFVFGGACLLHDLGMGLAAYPEGLSELRRGPQWQDTVASCYRDYFQEWPTPEALADIPSPLEDLAVRRLLRQLHADRAESLALISWKAASKSGATYYLIDDTDLRDSWGPLIGRIAASHGWSTSKLPDEFPQSYGAPVDCPSDWEVDALKISCLLRLADISHLDSRRAPGFLRAIRNIQGSSELHWDFQSHMHQLRREADRLIFSAARPFEIESAEAWWLGFDTLQAVQHELYEVDALLADNHRPRFAARNVFGAESPRRLSESIPTRGWTPVDARVTISDVPSLVRKLGGEELYGPNEHVALRELTQNATDASLAWAALSNQNPSPVQITLDEDESGLWLTVADTGIGMSRSVLSGSLLDFGTSYWGSELMLSESPGLMSSGFEPTGKYGIGFYSVFMLGDTVTITSRRHDEAKTDTNVLEFRDGLRARPILRKALPKEQRNIGGTSIRVLLTNDPYEPSGMLDIYYDGDVASLEDLCTHLFPGMRVNVCACDMTLNNDAQTVIIENDWIDIPANELVDRVSPDRYAQPRHLADFDSVVQRVRELKNSDGSIVGRGALSIPRAGYQALQGAVVTEGIRAGDIHGFSGILCGRATTASRNSALPLVEARVLSEWATEQGRLLMEEEEESSLRLLAVSAAVHRCYGDTGELPIAIGGKERCALNLKEFTGIASSLAQVNIFDTATVSSGPIYTRWEAVQQANFFSIEMEKISPDIQTFLVANSGSPFYIESPSPGTWPPVERPLEYVPHWNNPENIYDGRDWWYWSNEEPVGLIARALCLAWNCTLDEVLEGVEDRQTKRGNERHLPDFKLLFGTNSTDAEICVPGLVSFRNPKGARAQ